MPGGNAFLQNPLVGMSGSGSTAAVGIGARTIRASCRSTWPSAQWLLLRVCIALEIPNENSGLSVPVDLLLQKEKRSAPSYKTRTKLFFPL